jgi:transglutaminase-like putative cysteine protease
MLKALSLQTLYVAWTVCVALLLSSSVLAQEPHKSLYAIERHVLSIHVRADGTYEEKIESVTLAKSAAAIEAVSQDELDFYSDRETVKVLEAFTELPSGERIAVATDAIRVVDEERSDGAAMFSSRKTQVVIYPKISVGAKAHSTMLRQTHTPLFPGQFVFRRNLGPSVEYGHIEFNISHDPSIRIMADSRGFKGGRIADGPDGTVRYRYSFAQPVTEPLESGQVSAGDFGPYVHLSTFENPLAVGRVYEKAAAPKAAVTPEVQKLADEITSGLSDPKDQARALYNWVSQEIRYVAIFLGSGGVVPNPADHVIRNRYGDCKDKTTLLIAMLAAKGIEATTAMVNSGTAFEIPRLGSVSPFNHVIAYLPKWDLYLDPTAELAPFGVLPISVMDKPTVLTALDRVGRTPSMEASTNWIKSLTKIQISADGQIAGSASSEYAGHSDYSARLTFVDHVGEYKEELVQSRLRSNRQSGVGRYTPSDARDLNTPFTNRSTFTLDPVANFPGLGALNIPVGLTPTVISQLSYNRPKERLQFPFVCRSYRYEETYEVSLPAEARITRIPQDVSFNEAGLFYQATYRQHGQVVIAKRILQAQRPGMVCQPEEYQITRRLHPVVQRDIRAQIFYE